MSLIYVNEHAYAPHDPVTWEDAIQEGGFYFSRACYLGIPRPPAILFAPNDPRYLTIMGRYHEKFVRAEARLISEMEPED